MTSTGLYAFVVVVGFFVVVRGFVVVVLLRLVVVVVGARGRLVLAVSGAADVVRGRRPGVWLGSGASVGTSVSGVLAAVADGGRVLRDAVGPPPGVVRANAGPPTTRAAATPPITGRRR